jgi:glycosyltransferase involved in cell wall biosynthesis
MNDSPDRPKIAKAPITVLLPAFNQAAGLEEIARRWLRELDRLDRPYELVLIDDGSTDGTAAVMGKLATDRPAVRILRHEQRRGIGACLRTGLGSAQQSLLIYTACDYPYVPADLKKLLDAIDAVDLVTGVRTDPVPGWMRKLGAAYRVLVRVVFGVQLEPRAGWRGWAEWWRAVWLRVLFGLRVHDVPCAFKLFRRSLFDRLPIQSDGEFVHAEILAKANFLGCWMSEVPIGRLGGAFRGVAEPPPAGVSYAAEARRVFRDPKFLPAPPVATTAQPEEHAEAAAGERGPETQP